MKTQSTRTRIVASALAAMLLVAPMQANAGFSLGDVWSFGKKVVKKTVVPVTILVGVTADAAETFAKTKSWEETTKKGAVSLVEHVEDAVVETVSDIKTIVKSGAEIIRDY
jgi:hypothetical protein